MRETSLFLKALLLAIVSSVIACSNAERSTQKLNAALPRIETAAAALLDTGLKGKEAYERHAEFTEAMMEIGASLYALMLINECAKEDQFKCVQALNYLYLVVGETRGKGSSVTWAACHLSLDAEALYVTNVNNELYRQFADKVGTQEAARIEQSIKEIDALLVHAANRIQRAQQGKEC